MQGKIPLVCELNSETVTSSYSSHEKLALQLMNCGASAHFSHGRRTSIQPFLLKCVRRYAKIEVCKEKLYTLALSSKTQTIWREEGLRCAQV